jgi:hypothetical protein
MILVNVSVELLNCPEEDISAARRGEGQLRQKSKPFVKTEFVLYQREDTFRQAQ